MRSPISISPSEKRLVFLLLILTVLGGVPRCADRWSPALDLWLRSDPFHADHRDEAGPGPDTPAPGGSPEALAGGIDPNRADEIALRTLPGVGPVLARRIVEARRESRFAGPEDLLRVSGIGPATLAKLRPHLVWAPAGDSSGVRN